MISSSSFNKNTVAEMLCQRATQFPNNKIYHFPEHKQVYTWLKIHNEVRLITEGLIRLNIKKGDRIAILMEGRMEFILSMFAAASIGAVTVPINTYSKKRRNKGFIKRCPAQGFNYGYFRPSSVLS
jgi:fatty-acyl-CoA synthase